MTFKNLMHLAFSLFSFKLHSLQYLFNLPIHFWRPSCDKDSMIKLSSFIRAVICSLFKHGECVLTVFSLLKRSLTYMLNRFGLNEHPRHKPFEHKTNCARLLPSLTADDEFLYMLCIMLKNCPFT